jgi:hypothetical protein
VYEEGDLGPDRSFAFYLRLGFRVRSVTGHLLFLPHATAVVTGGVLALSLW